MNERSEKQQMWYCSIWKNEERTINGMSSDLKFLLLTYLTNNRIKTHIPNKQDAIVTIKISPLLEL